MVPYCASMTKCAALSNLLLQAQFCKIKEMRRSRTPLPDWLIQLWVCLLRMSNSTRSVISLVRLAIKTLPGCSSADHLSRGTKTLDKKGCAVFSYWTQLLQVKLMYSWLKRRRNVNRRQQYCRSYILWIAFPENVGKKWHHNYNIVQLCQGIMIQHVHITALYSKSLFFYLFFVYLFVSKKLI